jgi:hypothetical protein
MKDLCGGLFVWYSMNMNRPSIEQLTHALRLSWSADTCYDAHEWTKENPGRGQCVSSSLVLQDYLGGDLLRYHVTEGELDEKHYCNVLDNGTIIDTTGLQYEFPVNLRLKPVDLRDFTSIREKCLADSGTRRRYELLKSRVSLVLDELMSSVARSDDN